MLMRICPKRLKRRLWFGEVSNRHHRSHRIKDLAAATEGYSGADIAGLVRSAGSHALARTRAQGDTDDLGNLIVTLEDVVQALQEVKVNK